MQTFLPHSDYRRSAEILDRARLGKQRVEVMQLLKALKDPEAKGWTNHPCTVMWRGYENQLVIYGDIMCQVWIERGYKDTCRPKILAYYDVLATNVVPPFVGDIAFHISHQSNLVRKLPEHYRKFFPDVPDNLPYKWPIIQKAEKKKSKKL